MLSRLRVVSAGPVADQPVRPRTPPGVGTPLRADGLPGRRHPQGMINGYVRKYVRK